MFVDGNEVARQKIERTVPVRFSLDETLDIGMDTGTPVSEQFADRMPFQFTGILKKVVIELGKNGLAAGDLRMLEKTANAIAAQE